MSTKPLQFRRRLETKTKLSNSYPIPIDAAKQAENHCLNHNDESEATGS